MSNTKYKKDDIRVLVEDLYGSDMVKKYEEHEKYLRSDKNFEICKSHIEECHRLAEVASKYNGRCQELMKKAKKDVVFEEYSLGGSYLHRDYYCPSPILDIVIGNCKRGKILKRITKKSKPTHRYCFDHNKKLIFIEIYYSIGQACEIIFNNHGQKEIGVSFRNSDVNILSECMYDDNGRIISYTKALYTYLENYVNEISGYEKESYSYSDKGLEIADWLSFSNSKEQPMLTREQYYFQHDDEGYISKYKSTSSDKWFDSRVKRKV